MSLFTKFRDAVKGGVAQAIRRIVPEPIKERAVRAVRKTIEYIDDNINKVSDVIDNWEHQAKREDRYEQGDVLFDDIPSPYQEEYTREKPTIEEDETKKWYPSQIKQAQNNDELWEPNEGPAYGQEEQAEPIYDPFFDEYEEVTPDRAQIMGNERGQIVIEVRGDYAAAKELVTETLRGLDPDEMIIVKVLADFNRRDNGITRHWKSCTAVIEAEFAAATWLAGLYEIESEYNVTAVNPIQYVIERI